MRNSKSTPNWTKLTCHFLTCTRQFKLTSCTSSATKDSIKTLTCSQIRIFSEESRSGSFPSLVWWLRKLQGWNRGPHYLWQDAPTQSKQIRNITHLNSHVVHIPNHTLREAQKRNLRRQWQKGQLGSASYHWSKEQSFEPTLHALQV